MADLNRIVRRLEPLLGRHEGDPEPLEGGITNHNFRVRLGGQDHVLRLPGKDTSLLGISREAERLASERAAELGIGPPVSAVLDDCLVTRYIPCAPLAADEVARAAGEVATALRAFHDSGLELPTRFDVAELLEEYARIAGERGAELPAAYADAREIAARFAADGRDRPAAPCHDDLLAANVIRERGDAGHDDRGRLLIVDWEYAGMGDRFFDLGNLSVNNDFDADGEERMLTAYLGRPATPAEHHTLALAKAASDAREGAWGVVQATISELRFDFAAYSRRHFARMLATAATTDLPA